MESTMSEQTKTPDQEPNPTLRNDWMARIGASEAAVKVVQLTHCSGLRRKRYAETDPDPDLPKVGLTKRQAAQVLGVSEKTIERLVTRGLLKPSRALRTPRFWMKSLIQFLEATSR